MFVRWKLLGLEELGKELSDILDWLDFQGWKFGVNREVGEILF